MIEYFDIDAWLLAYETEDHKANMYSNTYFLPAYERHIPKEN